ncbi:hypothetical protein KM043_015052 [Ampulex compressa]|nr:hypothetical protein KM043_015052 [Ampulex compressa]
MSGLPDPRGNDTPSEFFTTFLFIAFIVLMYAMRPKSLQSQGNDRAKRREDGHDWNDEPPAPPPRAN